MMDLNLGGKETAFFKATLLYVKILYHQQDISMCFYYFKKPASPAEPPSPMSMMRILVQPALPNR